MSLMHISGDTKNSIEVEIHHLICDQFLEGWLAIANR